MKNIIKILLILLVLGCSSDDEPSNNFSITDITPLTGRMGDIMTVRGNNVLRLTQMYFKNNHSESINYSVKSGNIILPETTEQQGFYIIPNVHSEKAIIGKAHLQGGQGDKDNFQFNFNTVGFFQIKTGMPFENNTYFSKFQLQTVNDNLAFALIDGQIYKSTNGYYKWNLISTITLANIDNYYFLDENNGWFFNYENGKLNMYHTQDGGKTLSLRFTSNELEFHSPVYRVKFINPNFGLFSIAGKTYFTDNNTYKDIYEQYPDLNNLPFGKINLSEFTIRNENTIYLSTGGPNYSLIKVENSVASYIDGFTGTPRGNAQFFGNIGFLHVYNSIYKTMDNGVSWHIINNNISFTKIHYFDEQIGLAIDLNNNVYKTIDGGNTWFEYFFPKEYKHKSTLTTSNKNYSWLFNIEGKLYKYIEE